VDAGRTHYFVSDLLEAIPAQCEIQPLDSETEGTINWGPKVDTCRQIPATHPYNTEQEITSISIKQILQVIQRWVILCTLIVSTAHIHQYRFFSYKTYITKFNKPVHYQKGSPPTGHNQLTRHTARVRAVTRLRWLGASVSPQRLMFDQRSVHVGFVVNKVAVGQVFSLSESIHKCYITLSSIMNVYNLRNWRCQ